MVDTLWVGLEYYRHIIGRSVILWREGFVLPAFKIEWFLNDEPLLFKSTYAPAYDHGILSLRIDKVF